MYLYLTQCTCRHVNFLCQTNMISSVLHARFLFHGGYDGVSLGKNARIPAAVATPHFDKSTLGIGSSA